MYYERLLHYDETYNEYTADTTNYISYHTVNNIIIYQKNGPYAYIISDIDHTLASIA